ncbi:MAG: nitroreductase family protein [Chloroflexi bacterium]|nr:nitroreductase family protein [Chloroflexota bacterium]
MPDISLFDAINAQRAIRYFKTDPISDDVLDQILSAALRAPSGGNSQPWAFVAVRDADIKRQLAVWYKDFWDNVYSKRVDRRDSPVSRSAENLVNTFADVPAVIIPCIRGAKGSSRDTLTTGASIYPAAQNLMLAALALGVGSVITTFLQNHEEKVKELLGIPDDYQTACAIPMGYPSGEETFGGSRRRPLAEVVHYDRW